MIDNRNTHHTNSTFNQVKNYRIHLLKGKGIRILRSSESFLEAGARLQHRFTISTVLTSASSTRKAVTVSKKSLSSFILCRKHGNIIRQNSHIQQNLNDWATPHNHENTPLRIHNRASDLINPIARHQRITETFQNLCNSIALKQLSGKNIYFSYIMS